MNTDESSALKTYDLGDLTLESGRLAPNLRMSCTTFGQLSPARDNAVLLLHGLVADHTQLESWVGTHSIFDPERYFLILPDTLGTNNEDAAASTSPSRSGAGRRFPRFTMRDMVAAEYRLVTQGLGIDHLLMVAGVSLGGIGTLQWGVSFPDFMDAIVPVTPASRTARSTALLMEAARRAIMLDPKWCDGDYAADDPPREGVMTGLYVQALFGGSSQGFQERFGDNSASCDFYLGQSRALAAHADARDWVYRTWAADAHDIAVPFGGSIEQAAATIRARMLVIVNRRDQLIPPHESGLIELMAAAPNAKLVDADDLGGHYFHHGRAGMALIATEVRDLLDRMTAGTPGFSGPRYPRHWSRADLTPEGA